MELGRRRAAAPLVEFPMMRASSDAYRAISSTLSDLQHEEFWVLLINRANQIVKKCFISKGGMNSTVVDPKMIFKAVLDHGMGGLVLCHNHPSGTVKPSQQDLNLTKRLMECANILDISLLDHMIVRAKTYFSCGAEGLL